MVRKYIVITAILSFFYISGQGQARGFGPFGRADTLRGSLTAERRWWDVQRYDLTIQPDYDNKYTSGNNIITYKVNGNDIPRMQIDLQEPLVMDSAIMDGKARLPFNKDRSVWYINVPRQAIGSLHKLQLYFSGHPHIAVRPPWDGGWSFTKDSLGRPWMTVCCQGLGASIWYPCKDHQSDEPDMGATLTMIVPDTLTGISNGRLLSTVVNHDGTTSYKWGVVSPISTYCLIPYIGKYANFKETYYGANGNLDLSFWPLDYHLATAKPYFHDQVSKMLAAYEYWFGPYPFYEDGYKLVEVENTGMEHQSAVSYGNHYGYGYRGRDDSHTGYGMQCDFIIVHESGHEWWGNNLTSKDLADMWVHESFTNYAEALYTEYHWGKKAGDDYVYGVRSGIHNQGPIVPAFNVNAEGTGDMYPKGGNMLHTIRHSINNDALFRDILHGLQRAYYHQTVTGKEVIHYFNKKAGYDYSKVFEQYLTKTQIPQLDYYFKGNKVYYKWDSCITGFNLPIAIRGEGTTVKLFPTDTWKSSVVTGAEKVLLQPDIISYLYYIHINKLKKDL